MSVGDEAVDVKTNEEKMFVLRFSKVWEDSLDLRWERMFRDSRKALKFAITATATNKNYRVERHFSFSESFFRLTGLEPGMELTVELRVLVEEASAAALFGGSPFLESTLGDSSEHTPRSPLSNTTASGAHWVLGDVKVISTRQAPTVKVKKVHPDRLSGIIIVDEVDEREGPTMSYSQVERYEVNVIQKERLFATHAADIVVDGKARSFEALNMVGNLIYFVKVRAVSENGTLGRWSAPVRFITLDAVAVSVVMHGETYALLRWCREGHNPGDGSQFDDADDAIEEFCLEMTLLPDKRALEIDNTSPPIQICSKVFTRDTVKYLAEDLLPGREYVIRTRYRNTLGDYSEWSETSVVTLAPIAPPQVTIVAHNYIQAWWQRGNTTGDVAEEMSRNVSEWEVEYQCTDTGETSRSNFRALNVEARLLQLSNGSEYTIRARARDLNNEWGPWSEPTYVNTLHSLAPRCESSGDTWMQINWDRSGKRYADNISRYHVQVSCATSPFRASKYFPSSQLSYVFDQLKPNTRYFVAIQACSEDKWGPWSRPQEFSTCKPCELELVRRSEDVLHIKWQCEYYTRNKVEPLDQRFLVRFVSGGTVLSEEETANTNFRKSNLKPGMHLSAYVRAFDYQQFSWGCWSEEFVLTTLAPVVTPVTVGETFIQVSWNKHPKLISCLTDQQLALGMDDALSSAQVTKYIVRVCALSKGGLETELSKFHLEAGHPTFYTITDLAPDKLYSVQISVLDTNGIWSPFSTQNAIQTIPALHVHVQDVGEHYANLTWQRDGPAETTTGMESRIVCKNVDDEAVPEAKFHVIGEYSTVLRHLNPNTTYEIHVSAKPTSIDSWGAWSAPVYVRTSTSVVVELESVGESYAHLHWHRAVPLTTTFRGAQTIVAGITRDKSNAVAQAGALEGKVLYIGDPTPTEYHVKIVKVPTGEAALVDAPKALVFEVYLAAHQTAVRIPALSPDTEYEAMVCACTKTGEWGQWSNLLCFSTSAPTEIRIKDVTQDGVLCDWAQMVKSDTARGENEDFVSYYQLKLSGMDDDFNQDITLPPGETSYGIVGLCVNACYSVCVRPFMRDDNDWGPYCNRAFLCVRALPVDIQESCEDWIAVCWENRPVPDNRVKVLLLTLMGESTSITVQLEDINATGHVFHNLNPNSCYTIHLLCIEQSPCYLKNGGFIPQQNRRRTEVTTKDMHEKSLTMPVIAADYRNVLADGCTVYTQRVMLLQAVRVGENFATLTWGKADDSGDFIVPHSVGPNDEFEVDVTAVDGTQLSPELVEFTKQHLTGNVAVVRPLTSTTRYTFRVRCLGHTLDVPTMWSAPITLTTLQTVVPALGGIDALTNDDLVQGIGEDYVTFNWAESMQDMFLDAQSTSLMFQPRIVNKTTGEEEVVETTDCCHTFANLAADTTYVLSVRTVITYSEPVGITECAASSDSFGGDKVYGEWSQPLTATTLGPMVVRVIDAAETFATVQWRRRVHGGEQWGGQQDTDHHALLRSVSSFHIRVQETTSALCVYEQQYLEGDLEYDELAATLRSLQPGIQYSVFVRASTMNQWGSWSDGITFSTLTPLTLHLALVAEEKAFLQWNRAVQVVDGAICVKNWEVSASTVGANPVTATMLVPPDRNAYILEGLQKNTSYHIQVRPLYAQQGMGPWSNRISTTTLGEMRVEVARIGEIFVNVGWHRVEQKRISSRLRRRISGDVQRATTPASVDPVDSTDPISLSEMLGGSDPLFEPSSTKSADSNSKKKRASVVDPPSKGNSPTSSGQQKHMTATTSARLTEEHARLQEMQIVEMERECIYPTGDDLRFEIVITATGSTNTIASPHQTAAAEEGKEEGASNGDGDADPMIGHKPFRRRLGKGESACRMEGLEPQTQYNIVVRALFTNSVSLAPFLEPGQTEDDVLWGAWSSKVFFTTLKPIALLLRGVCSESIVVEWDTGAQNVGRDSAVTAISKYELMVTERARPGVANPARHQHIIEDAAVRSFRIMDLRPENYYIVKVRVCYEEDKWGVWSQPVNVLTLPALNAQVQSISECKVEFLIWREEQYSEDPAFLPWAYESTKHQLRINAKQTPQPFILESATSTLLTLDTLMTDNAYEIQVRDEDVDGEWLPWCGLLNLETRPHAPTRVQLRERRGQQVAVIWDHQRNPAITSRYVYQLEVAELLSQNQSMNDSRVSTSMSKKSGGSSTSKKGKKKADAPREHGSFRLVGSTTDTMYRFTIDRPVNECFFRVRVCKEGHNLDGAEFAPLAPDADGRVEVKHQDALLWSKWSPVATFRTPSIPDHPSELHVTHLTHNSAILRWRRPQNHEEHDGLMYKVFLSNQYGEPFVYLGSSEDTNYNLVGLVPNCHYRAMVTAESRMGNSRQNKTLHFSTRILKDLESSLHPTLARAAATLPTASSPLLMQRIPSFTNPITSSLPPRSAIRVGSFALRPQDRKVKEQVDRAYNQLMDERNKMLTSRLAHGSVPRSHTGLTPAHSHRGTPTAAALAPIPHATGSPIFDDEPSSHVSEFRQQFTTSDIGDPQQQQQSFGSSRPPSARVLLPHLGGVNTNNSANSTAALTAAQLLEDDPMTPDYNAETTTPSF
eukprot:PhM_4_TR13192/c0_g1_i1/m.24804